MKKTVYDAVVDDEKPEAQLSELLVTNPSRLLYIFMNMISLRL
jgi:hypothetical protein